MSDPIVITPDSDADRTVTPLPPLDARDLGYVPSDPGSWPEGVPGDPGAALDTLAARAGGGPGASTEWGQITGTLSDQVDLDQALGSKAPVSALTSHTTATTDAHGGIVASTDPRLTDARTPTAHTHAPGDVTGLDSALASKADLVGGKVPSAQIPALAITETHVVASQIEMLALVAQTGDIAVRTDLPATFVLAGSDPAELNDWTQLLVPVSDVQSVNTQTGAVVLGPADVGAAPASHQHSALDVTSGVLDAARLPVGTASGTVAAGDHTHTPAQIGAVAALGGVTGIEVMTETEYDALVSPDPFVLYVVVPDP